MKKKITITGELLEEYGFQYGMSYDWGLVLPNDMGELMISEKQNRNAVLKQDDDIVALMKVNYLHELKHVYFSITGMELKKKKTENSYPQHELKLSDWQIKDSKGNLIDAEKYAKLHNITFSTKIEDVEKLTQELDWRVPVFKI